MLRAAPVALLAAAVVGSSPARNAATAPTAVTHPVVTVHAREFAFLAPASIPAGTTTFRLVNDGQEMHQISLVQLAPGKTLTDFAAAMKANAPAPWAVGVGGPNAAAPGQTIDATVTLEPGNYVLVCWIPSPGAPVPHMAKGMIQPLTVTGPGGATPTSATPTSATPTSATTYAADPTPDVHLELSDYAFRFSKPLTAGTHTIHVMNLGPQQHEAVLVKLAPGKTMKDFHAWFDSGMQGPPPAMPTPGMAGLGKGRTGTFTTTLTPGRYGLVCYIPDAKDGRPHEMHGMVQEFTVAAP